jgi:hypothetical protein
MKCVIFTGPTIRKEEALPLLEAVYLPPARQGDVIGAIFRHMPDIIGIIDGASYPELEVWHREILYALENGVAVFGSSSTGALRAAELDIHGMQGVGRIYEEIRGRETVDADEVTCLHEDRSPFRRLSEPMVNIRATLGEMRRKDLIDDRLLHQLLGTAKSIHYTKRTWQAIFDKAGSEGALTAEKVRELLRRSASCNVDLARSDAILLLKAVRKAMETGRRAPYGKIVDRSDNIVFHVAKYRDRAISRDDDLEGSPLFSIVDYILLTHPAADELAVRAKNRFLAGILADMLHVEVSGADIDKETETFRIRHSLRDDESLGDWLAGNDLVHEEFMRLMEQNAKMRALHNWLRTRLAQRKFTRVLLDELMLTNQYSGWAGKALLAERLFQRQRGQNEEICRNEPLEKMLREHLTESPREWHRIFWNVVDGVEITEPLLKYQLVKARIEREALESAIFEHLAPAAEQ